MDIIKQGEDIGFFEKVFKPATLQEMDPKTIAKIDSVIKDLTSQSAGLREEIKNLTIKAAAIDAKLVEQNELRQGVLAKFPELTPVVVTP